MLALGLIRIFALANPSAAAPTDSLDSLHAVHQRVRIGAEIFLDPGHTPEEIRHHFSRMRETGLTVARLFIIWDHIERQPGEWSFDLYDAAYDAAAANGLSILATLCADDPPGWARETPFYHQKLALNTPAARARAAEYIERVVTRYRDHPAQGPWSLSNEPTGLPEEFDPPTLVQFGAWLERKYGTVTQLNARWFRPIAGFDQVNFDRAFATSGWTDYAALLDWKWFRIQQQTDQLAWLRDQVRRHDPRHPTHANPAGLAGNMPARGADLWSEKQAVDFIGATEHASHQFRQYAAADVDFGHAFINDLLRSGRDGAPWWITELQAGLSLFGGRAHNPGGHDLVRRVWDGIGAGAKGVILWCWHPRRFGREAGEWGLVAPDGSPTPRSEAIAALARILANSGAFLHGAEPLPARVAILYDRQALVLASIDERVPADTDRVLHSLLGVHRALTERQIPVDFVTEDDLKNDRTSRYDVLYLPHVYAMDDATVSAVRRFVEAGGTVWADGPLAWKTDAGRVRSEMPGDLTDVFGLVVGDILPEAAPFPFTSTDVQAGDSMRLTLGLRGAETVASDRDGRPIATRHRFGRGTALYFATALAAGYHRHPDPQARQFISEAALASASTLDITARSTSARIVFRPLRSTEGLAAILVNHGETSTVHVTFRGPVRSVAEVTTGRSISVATSNGRSEVEISVPADGVAVLLACPPSP
ncbi:MAG: beta-galactosidase [Opitutaceae bacterium]|nr:beta-galactosidase [Opitutaceae bacterium]